MNVISWGILVPVLVVVAVLYFLVRSRRKNRDGMRKRG